jgi:CBS domain-containing protein
MREIKKAESAKDLKNCREKLTVLVQASISKNIPLYHISAIAGEITNSITKRAIELTILELGSPPTRFAWFAIGSQGRKEQVLLTDQDNFLIFDDVSPENYREVKDYFLKLAKKTTGILEKIGFDYCPNNNLASNIVFCKSLTDWTKHFNNWITEPIEAENEICNIFLDFDLVYGEVDFEKELANLIFQNRKNNSYIFDYLGNITLKKPLPFNFFKKLNIEEEGDNKAKFDIKNKGLMPLIDAARLLVLGQNISGIGNTYLRFKQLAMIDVNNKEIYKNSSEAFNELSRLSTLEGIKNDSNGQFIAINELSKSDKDKLKAALLPFKDLEDIIKEKFTLTHFS